MLDADVAVVGAGPAGTAAAITLARAGRRVILVDKARFPRDKCCGDGLTTGALRRLESLGLDPAAVPSWQPVHQAVVRSPKGRQAVFPLPVDGGVFAASATRLDLDAALVDLARSSGAEVIEGAALRGASLSAGGRAVRLELEGSRDLSAGYALGADGMWSPLRKAVGSAEPGYLGEWHAIRQYFSGVAPAARDLWVFFEEDLLPGYAWSFPLPGDRANVGFGVQRSAGTPTGRIKAQWDDILSRPHIAAVLGPRAKPDGAFKTWPIPARIGRSRLAALGGRVLFVGDAARATDCMTGEGIAQAIETGRLAGNAVAGAGPDRPGMAAATYHKAVTRGLAVDDRVSRLLSWVLTKQGLADRWMALVDRSDSARTAFARWMFEDYPRALLLTPRRWAFGALHGPGAFHPAMART